MSDDAPKRTDWAITFIGRLCLIGWICAIFYEAFDFFSPVRQFSLLFGPWACIIALINAFVLLMLRRQGIFLLFFLLTLPPTVHFGIVLKNIVVARKWFSPAETRADHREVDSKSKPIE